MSDYSFSGGIVRGLGLGLAQLGSRVVQDFATPIAAGLCAGFTWNTASGLSVAVPPTAFFDTSFAAIPTAGASGMSTFYLRPQFNGFAPVFSFARNTGVLIDEVWAWLAVAGGSVTINGFSLQLVDGGTRGATLLARPIAELGQRASSQVASAQAGVGLVATRAPLPTIQRPILLTNDDLGATSLSGGALGLLCALDLTSGATKPTTIDLYVRISAWNVSGVHLDG